MEEKQTVKPSKGTWDNLPTGEERKPKIEFRMDSPQKIFFKEDFKEPREYPNKNEEGYFYIFDCTVAGEERVLMASAWSLLRGLKSFYPLGGKTLTITKKMEKGKQYYEVKEASLIEDVKPQ